MLTNRSRTKGIHHEDHSNCTTASWFAESKRKRPRLGASSSQIPAKEKPLEGQVISVGSGQRLEDGTLIPMDVKAGDRILFGKYAGTEIKLEGIEHLILKEEEVLGVLT